MPASPQPRPSAPRHSPCAGFSLVELAVVVAIISIFIAIALPIGQHLVRQARSAAVINDLRVFSAAFQAYANEHGDWPDGDGTPGAFPPGMETYLRQTNWQHPTPIGGSYAWDPNSTQGGGRYRAAIVISSIEGNPVSADAAQLLDLDRKLDDGNLATGNFVLGFQDEPVFVLEH
ncbi:MAG TPA: prepilin-type N-terminal cleavage/methylation domain-containing protein [Opitutus sp.]|nr:prepilin-type N-terminal cleavage/methylation domain-containing protein [Opitutus sp.]